MSEYDLTRDQLQKGMEFALKKITEPESNLGRKFGDERVEAKKSR